MSSKKRQNSIQSGDSYDRPSSCEIVAGNEQNQGIRSHIDHYPSSEIYHAVQNISFGDKSAYISALEKAPDLVQTESDPNRYLQCCQGKAEQAAKKMVNYWQQRQRIFEERAFLPILDLSASGALEKECIDFFIKGGAVELPKDSRGRSVFFLDYQSLNWRKDSTRKYALQTLFYCQQLACGNPITQTNGFLVIGVFELNEDMQDILQSFLDDVFPFKCKFVHFCVSSPSVSAQKKFMDIVAPKIRSHWKKSLYIEGFIHILDRNNNSGFARILAPHGLAPESLPESIGGNWHKRRVKNQPSQGLIALPEAILPIPSDSRNTKAKLPNSSPSNKKVYSLPHGDEKLFGFTQDEMMKSALEHLENAIELISEEKKSAFLEAKNQYPDIFEAESIPHCFLRCENYNPWAAACRIVTYWEKRKQVFGERAFLPMNLSGEGTLLEEDMVVFNHGVLSLLANDKKQRSVLFADRSKSAVSSIKALFFVFQKLSENPVSQKEGPIVLFQVDCMRGTGFNKVDARSIAEIIDKCLPMKPPQFHFVCFPSIRNPTTLSSFADNIIAQGLNKLGPFFSKHAVIHAGSSREEALEKLLAACDLDKQDLPEGLGGSLNSEGFVQWQLQCGRAKVHLEDVTSLVLDTVACYSAAAAKASSSEPPISTSVKSPPYAAKTSSQLADTTCLSAAVYKKRYRNNAKVKPPTKKVISSTSDDAKRRDKKRKMDVIYARRKREREKIEIEVLQDERNKLRIKNGRLKEENRQLDIALKSAKELVARLKEPGSR